MSKKRDWNEVVRVRPRQGRAEFLRLDMNENPEGLPKAFHRKVLRQITPGFLSMYPEPERLILELSRSLGVSSQSLFLSNGSDESIKSIFEVFGEPGKKVVTVAPTFEMYGVYAKMFQMVHCPVSYSQGMFLDLEAILAAIDGETSLVSVLNPNNPIGTVFSVAEVRRIIDKAREVGALVILDEAYHYFYDQTFLGLVSEYDHVLLTRTFSKLCSIAGLRIGYTVGNPSLIALLEKVRQTFNVNSVALLYATEILKDPILIPRLREIERKGREYLLEKLRLHDLGYYAENGNYVFIACKKPATEVAAALEARKILVKIYGHELLRPYIRVTTGSVVAMKRFWNIYQTIEDTHA